MLPEGLKGVAMKRPGLENLRIEIDAIDDQLLDLLRRRIGLAYTIGLLKDKANIEIDDPLREQKQFQRLCERLHNPLDQVAPEAELHIEDVKALFDMIYEMSKRVQYRVKK